MTKMMRTEYIEVTREINEFASLRITWNSSNPNAIVMGPTAMDSDAMRIVAKELLEFASVMDREKEKAIDVS